MIIPLFFTPSTNRAASGGTLPPPAACSASASAASPLAASRRPVCLFTARGNLSARTPPWTRAVLLLQASVQATARQPRVSSQPFSGPSASPPGSTPSKKKPATYNAGKILKTRVRPYLSLLWHFGQYSGNQEVQAGILHLNILTSFFNTGFPHWLHFTDIAKVPTAKRVPIRGIKKYSVTYKLNKPKIQPAIIQVLCNNIIFVLTVNSIIVPPSRYANPHRKSYQLAISLDLLYFFFQL